MSAFGWIRGIDEAGRIAAPAFLGRVGRTCAKYGRFTAIFGDAVAIIMFVIATAGGADASFTKGACVATRAAVLFAGRCVKTGTVTEGEGLTVEFAGTGDAAFSFGTGCEAVSAMGIIVGEIETLSVAHRFVGQTVMRVFGATASDTGLIVETRGSARGVIVDASASDTGLIVETRGLTRCVVIDTCAFDTGLVVETRGLTWDNRFDATASDTGLIVETRGLTRCVVIDTCAFDTGLVVETRGLTRDNRFDAMASDTGFDRRDMRARMYRCCKRG